MHPQEIKENNFYEARPRGRYNNAVRRCIKIIEPNPASLSGKMVCYETIQNGKKGSRHYAPLSWFADASLREIATQAQER